MRTMSRRARRVPSEPDLRARAHVVGLAKAMQHDEVVGRDRANESKPPGSHQSFRETFDSPGPSKWLSDSQVTRPRSLVSSDFDVVFVTQSARNGLTTRRQCPHLLYDRSLAHRTAISISTSDTTSADILLYDCNPPPRANGQRRGGGIAHGNFPAFASFFLSDSHSPFDCSPLQSLPISLRAIILTWPFFWRGCEAARLRVS